MMKCQGSPFTDLDALTKQLDEMTESAAYLQDQITTARQGVTDLYGKCEKILSGCPEEQDRAEDEDPFDTIFKIFNSQ